MTKRPIYFVLGFVLTLATIMGISYTSGNPAIAFLSPSTATNTPLPPTGTPTVTPSPTPTVTPTFTPSPTLTPTITPTPPCSALGTLEEVVFDSDVLNYETEMAVYLPPCYATHNTTQRYPVLYLIHGLEQTNQIWIDLGVVEVADRLITSGDVAPFIIVLPREYRDERFNRAMVNDIIPYTDSNYRTLAERDNRALGGLSRGGAWTARIGFQHPELFVALGLHSPAIFYADEVVIGGWLTEMRGDPPEIWIDIGDLDGLIISAGWLHEALERRDIDHIFNRYPGAHNQVYWAYHIEDYLQWYAAQFSP